MKIQTTQAYNEKKEKNSALGTMAGGTIGLASNGLLKQTGAATFTNKFIKNTELPEEVAKQVQKGVQDALEISGMKEKGFQIKLVNNKNVEEVAEELTEDLLNNLKKSFKPKQLENSKVGVSTLLSAYTNAVAEGKNAFCVSKIKKIILPDGKLTTAGFHEIGHAMNSATKLGKLAQGPLRLIGMIAPIGLTLYGAFSKNKKAEEGKELTKGQKASNFVRNNAGKLSFLAMTPILIEEGVASIKGGKLAKQVLSSDLAKKVSKTNKLAWCTYLCAAVAAGIGSFLAVKVKDKIQEKKNQKAQLNV